MRSLIWKELRETAPWAGVIAASLVLALAFALHMTIGSGSLNNPYGVGSVIDSAYGDFKIWMQVGAPIGALALGLLQIIPEQRRDQWAFLIHRPVWPQQIFLAKSIVGVGLYLCTTLLPLAAFTIWLGMQGHFPGPFTPILALPDIAAVASGTVFYFAAMLVVLRPARWCGSKLLPLVTAVAFVLCMVSCGVFGYALLISVAFAAVLLIAALGSFVTNGEYEGQTRLQRFALGSTMLVGAVAVVIAVVGIVASRLQPLKSELPVSFATSAQGKVVQLQTTFAGNIQRVFDIDGHPIVGADLSRTSYDEGNNATLIADGVGDYNQYDRYEQYFTLFQPFGLIPVQYDFYDAQSRIVDVYSVADNRLDGYIGSRGTMQATVESAGAFPESGSCLGILDSLSLIQFPHAIYTLDLATQRTALLARPPSGDIFGSVTVVSPVGQSNVSQYLFALFGRTIVAYNSSGQVVARLPYSESAADYSSVNIWALSNPVRFVLLYESGTDASAAYYQVHPWRAVIAEPPGRIVSNTAGYPVFVYSAQSATGPLSIVGQVFDPPALYGFELVVACVEGALGRPNWTYSLRDIVHDPNFGWTLMWIAIGAFVSGASVFGLSRRYGWSRRDTARWVVTGAALSWPGVLMLLAMVPFHARVACPACARQTPVSRATCPYCGSRTTEAKPDGTEIFEDLSPFAPQSTLVGIVD